MKTPLTAICAALVLIVAALPLTSLAQGVEAARVQETVATARFKRAAPYRVGVAAGYLSNSWVVFCLQHIRYEAARHKEISEVLVTDAGFNPGKQVADIEDLISKNVNLILYWPVDEKAIQPALEKAVVKGIPTVNTGGGFTYSPGTVANAFIDQVVLGDMVARQLFTDMRGGGKIIAMLPIAGTTAAVDQLAALKAAMKEFPQIELLSAEYGDWNRAKAKQITENLLQRHPRIDGAFSPAGQMSIGVAEAGEVHALVGANGAGKSTLMLVLAGVLNPTAGEIRLAGVPVTFGTPRAAIEAGVSIVYQETSAIPEMTVAENIFLGREPTTRLGWVDRQRLFEEARRLLDRYHLPLDPAAPVGRLTVAGQQLGAIARA